ncbi:MAG: hypothetical protein BGN88_15525 [Clostridiales bacterium 43-6]|nr:MAG: hypothetical protein BGN88_15525 [Clostridiales bacterium 43-6]
MKKHIKHIVSSIVILMVAVTITLFSVTAEKEQVTPPVVTSKQQITTVLLNNTQPVSEIKAAEPDSTQDKETPQKKQYQLPTVVENKNAVNKKTFELNGKTFELMYIETKKYPNSKVLRDCYKSKDGSNFEFDQQTGQLLSVNIDESIRDKTVKSLNEAQMIDIASDILKKYSKNTSDYVMDYINYNSTSEMYYIQFCRYRSGYKTSDFALINLTKDGALVSYICHPSKFEGIKVPKIDEKKHLAKLEQTVKEEYKEKFVSFSVFGKTLSINEKGELEISYAVDIKYKYDENELITREVYYFAV